MNTYIKNILAVVCILVAGLSNVAAQKDTCNVQSYVRADGVLIRGVDFEPLLENDSVRIFAAMYKIDKDYFLVVRLEANKKINYTNDLAIQLSDSTVILLPYDSNKRDRAKKTYDGYFKINSNDLGYIEKSTIVRINYYVDNKIRSLYLKQKTHILQRHFACLRNS